MVFMLPVVVPLPLAALTLLTLAPLTIPVPVVVLLPAVTCSRQGRREAGSAWMVYGCQPPPPAAGRAGGQRAQPGWCVAASRHLQQAEQEGSGLSLGGVWLPVTTCLPGCSR